MQSLSFLTLKLQPQIPILGIQDRPEFGGEGVMAIVLELESSNFVGKLHLGANLIFEVTSTLRGGSLGRGLNFPSLTGSKNNSLPRGWGEVTSKIKIST